MNARNRTFNEPRQQRDGGTIPGALILLLAAMVATSATSVSTANEPNFRGTLLRPTDISGARLQQLQNDHFNSVAILVESSEAAAIQRRAAELILDSPLDLYYWIEVARCPELADAHPEWMASLQTHDQWRRFFPDAPQPKADEVAKTYPWVPILSREPFVAQLTRVKRSLAQLPAAQGVFLNDLQGAPSACGCGNPLCRWTSDYGKKRTTVPLGDDAATLFVEAVQQSLSDTKVIPVWTTECEKHDGARDGLCAGVGCFDGICWKAYTRQLMPLQQKSKTIAVLTPFLAFQRDLPLYGKRAGWIKHAIGTFADMPPRHGGQAVPASRLIPVVQGWDVPAADVDAQIKMASAAGVQGYLVAFAKIEQSWQPRIVRWK